MISIRFTLHLEVLKIFLLLYLIILLSFFPLKYSHAQEPAMWQLTNEDGLPSMTVYEILQDQKGYIWIATARGLCRYDGRDFIKIKTTGLLDQEIVVIIEDNYGRIWFNNLSGQIGWIDNLQMHLLSLDNMSENYLPMRFFIKDSTLLVNHKDIEVKSKWLRLSLNKKTQPFLQKEIKGKPLDYNNTLFFNGKWYSKIKNNANGLEINYIDNDSVKVEYLSVEEGLEEKNNGYNLELIDPEGELYFSSSKGLYHYDKEGKINQVFDYLSIQANNYFISDNKIWIAAKNGVFTKDLSTDKIEKIISGIDVNAFYRDHENNIWLGTTGYGVFLIPNLDLRLFKADNSNLSKSDIYSLYYDLSDEVLYAGLSGAYLATFKKEFLSFENHKLPLSGRIVTIEKDSDKNLWLGLDGGVCVYNPSNKIIKALRSAISIKVIKKDKDNNLWLGTSNYTAKIDSVNHRGIFENPFNFDHSRTIILDRRTYGLQQDHLNRTWIGTTNGIYLYKQDSTQLLFENEYTYSVSDITRSSDSSIWVGTSGDGLLRIKNDQIVQQYTMAEGLTSNNCRSLYIDQEKLYLGTDDGLSILDLSKDEIEKIDINDGLPSGEINAVIAREGTVYLGTPKGLVMFEKAKLQKNQTAPAIWISGMNINGEEIEPENNRMLPYWQNTIDFQYEGLAYRARRGEVYKYRLLGLNDDWLHTDSRAARFHALRAGAYEFQVKTINEEGIESAVPASIKFEIRAPWWKTTWFYSGLVLGLMGLSGTITFWRQRDLWKREKVEQELKSRIQLLRTEALRTQMNPHFIYNALNAIQDFVVTNDHNSALFYLAKFAEMIRQIFDYSSRELITLAEEVQFLQLYLNLEKLRFGDRVAISFAIDDALKERLEEFEIPPLLIQPLVENAFKHGLMHKLNDGKLHIFFELEKDDQIKCTVEDNGVGRAEAEKYSKWKNKNRRLSGMEATRERLKIWKGESTESKKLVITDLKDETGKSLGTKIEIYI